MKKWKTDDIVKPETNFDTDVEDDYFTIIFKFICVAIITVVICLFNLIIGIIIGLLLLVFIVIQWHSLYYYKNYVKDRKNRYNNGKMSKEEAKKYEEDLQNVKNIIEYYKNQENNKELHIVIPEEIDYTIVVTTDSRKSASSTAVRGAIGGAIAGPAGLIGGAASGKNKQTTTFKIVYKSGKVEVKTVKNNSKEFIELAEHVR